MKKSSIIITLFIAIFISRSLFAQHTEVQEVQYQQSINMHSMMEGVLDSLGDEENSAASRFMKKFFGQHDVYRYAIYFDEEQAVMKSTREKNADPFGRFMKEFPLNYSIMNKKDQKSIYLYFDESGNFRTESPLEEPTGELELVEEEKIILGYICQKAIWTPANQNSYLQAGHQESYVIWFSPQLPAGLSPIGYVPVPGLVLAAESETTSTMATSIQASSWPIDLTELESFELLTDEEVSGRIFELMKGNGELFDMMDSMMEMRDELKPDKN